MKLTLSKLLILGILALLSPAMFKADAMAQDEMPIINEPNETETEAKKPYQYNDDAFKALDLTAGLTDRKSDLSALRRLEEGSRISRSTSPANSFNDPQETLFFNNDNIAISKFTDYNSWCKNDLGETGHSTCIRSDQKYTLPRTSGSKYASFNSLSAMGGVTDVLHSKLYQNQITSNITSPLSVLTSTMNLTEPGLARGVMDSTNFATNSVIARLNSDHAVFNRAQQNPATGELFASMYENCLTRKRAAGIAWIRAQSECLGGDRVTAEDTVFDTADAAASMKFIDDPNHPQAPESAGAFDSATYTSGTQVDENTITALDYMFNLEAAHMVTSPSSPSDGEHLASLQALRASFEALIGDIEFRIGKPDGQIIPVAAGAGPTTTTIEGTLAIETKKIPATISPNDFFRNLVMSRYRDFHQLLYARCLFEKNNNTFSGVLGGAPGGGTDDFQEMPKLTGGAEAYSDPSVDRTSFWADANGAHVLLTRLSTTGFSPQPQIVESVYGMFLDEQMAGHDDDAAAESQLVCESLLTGNGKPSNLSELLDTTGAIRSRKIAVNSRPRLRTVFVIAEHLALGQFLGTLSKAEDMVTSMTGGSYDSLIRRNMLDMIYGVAGTRDIRESVERNAAELRALAGPLIENFRIRNAENAGAIKDSMGTPGGQNAASVEQ